MSWLCSQDGDYLYNDARCYDNKCGNCDGYGYLEKGTCYSSGVAQSDEQCPMCKGIGYTDGMAEARYLQGIIGKRDAKIRELEQRTRKQAVMIEALIKA